jgi:hypothetical protein
LTGFEIILTNTKTLTFVDWFQRASEEILKQAAVKPTTERALVVTVVGWVGLGAWVRVRLDQESPSRETVAATFSSMKVSFDDFAVRKQFKLDDAGMKAFALEAIQVFQEARQITNIHSRPPPALT